MILNIYLNVRSSKIRKVKAVAEMNLGRMTYLVYSIKK